MNIFFSEKNNVIIIKEFPISVYSKKIFFKLLNLLKDDLYFVIKNSSITVSELKKENSFVDVYIYTKTPMSMEELKEFVYSFFELLISLYIKEVYDLLGLKNNYNQ